MRPASAALRVLRLPSPCRAFRRLAAPERFGNQRVGEDELGLGHFLDRQQNSRLLRRVRHRRGECARLPLHAQQQPRNRRRPSIATAISTLRRWPAKRSKSERRTSGRSMPGRGYFEPIGAIDRIGHVEHRRERARDRLAVLDRHRAVRPFGHDLDRAAVEPGNLHPHQAVPDAGQDGLGDGGHACGDALLRDQARLAILPARVSIAGVIRSAWQLPV